jgi:hypothetical protein
MPMPDTPRAMRPEQATPKAELHSACRTSARGALWLARGGGLTEARKTATQGSADTRPVCYPQQSGLRVVTWRRRAIAPAPGGSRRRRVASGRGAVRRCSGGRGGRRVVDEASEVERGGEPLAGLLGVVGLRSLPGRLLFALKPMLFRQPFPLLFRALPRNPQPNRAVPARGKDPAAVMAEGHGRNLVGVPPQDGQLLAGCGVPQSRRLVRARGDDAGAIGAESREISLARVPLRDGELLAGFGVPRPHRDGPGRGAYLAQVWAMPSILSRRFARRERARSCCACNARSPD